MKKSINLLSADLLPQQNRINATVTLSLWVLALVVACGVGFYEQWQLEQQQLKNRQLMTQQTQLQQQQEALTTALAQRKVSSQLELELTDLKQEWAIKQELIRHVAIGAEQAKSPYSVLLNNLASVHEPKLWLSGIQVSGEQVALSGFAADAQLVPIWLARVGEQGYLQGRNFGQLSIAEANRWHRFELKTVLRDEKEKSQ